MAGFLEQPPLQPFSGGTEMNWHDYFLKQQAFLNDVAKLQDEQAFTAQQSFIANGGISTSGGILLTDNYNTFIDVQVASDNAAQAQAGGGNAAIYVQHKINQTTALTNNVNSGIRVQVETAQTATPGLVNDVVGGYFGVRNSGTGVGAFGLHVDGYSNAAGATSSFYGMSVELYRETALGFTAAFHARSIDAPGYFDNDYGFLASPSVGGVRRFASIFSGGSSFTGTMLADFGLDLAFANCAIAAVRINAGQYVSWDGVALQIQQKYDNVGIWQHFVAGVLNFGLENTGRVYIVSNVNTNVATPFVASGQCLVINHGGTIRKIQLGVFP